MYYQHEFKAMASELVSKMTLDEKVSQLTYRSPAIERLGIPAYNWWNEALHGVARAGTATSFPQAIGLAAMFDEDILRNISDAIATEGRAKYNESASHGDRDIYKGITFWSPNVNIFRDPRWGRGHETYGEDPYLTSRLGVAFVKGLQGEGKYLKSAACVKHFAVHSGPEDLRHEFNAVVSQKDLYETYLPAFEACVKEAQVEAVMGAYNRINGEPCCGSPTLLKGILREKWQFDGHVVSDCGAIKDFHINHHVTATPEESAALALNAGCDLNCGNIYLFLLEALSQGLVTEAQITAAAERLFTTRFKLGLFQKNEYDLIPYEKVECSEHIKLAIEAARKSVVLLKNDGILPLNKNMIKTIGVIGPNANSRLALKGNYYGTSSRYITVLEGIQDEAGEGVRILYAEGCELVRTQSSTLTEEYDGMAEALTVAEHSDVVILCLGLDESMEGEERDVGIGCGSGDKNNLELPEVQALLLKKIIHLKKPTILCLQAGSAINLTFADEYVNAVMQAWYPGARGGKAVAEIIFGKCSPSGKLPVTFYRSLEALPDFTDYSMTNRTYRYFTGEALYPFGYGLTFGNVVCLSADFKGPLEKEKDLLIQVTVENQSSQETEDVVQIYVKDKESKLAVPNHSLCAFKRVRLGAWERKELVMPVAFEALKQVNDKGERILDSEKFTFFVGVSQPDDRSVRLTGKRPLILELNLQEVK